MRNNLILSVSREYGSGGREIAEKLAETLDMAYYDKLLLAKIAQESGFSDEVVAHYDEKPIDRFLLNPYSFLSGMAGNIPVAAEVHRIEVSIIRKAADEGPCIIVGRSADSLLSDRPGLVRLFVSAPLPDRIARVMRRNNLSSETEAKSRIAKVDKARAAYHEHFSDRAWGVANLYDLCIDSSKLSIEGTVAVIVKYLQTLTAENDTIAMPKARTSA